MFLNNWWNTQSIAEQAFWSAALVLSLLLIMQTLTTLLFDQEEDDYDLSDFRMRFPWLNVRMGLVFTTLTSWLGFFILQFGGSWKMVLLIASAMGLALAIGLEFIIAEHNAQKQITRRMGKVSESVPPHKIGEGKVRIKGFKQEWRAVTSGEAILPGVPVRIVEQVDEGTIEVEALPKKGKNPNSRG